MFSSIVAPQNTSTHRYTLLAPHNPFATVALAEEVTMATIPILLYGHQVMVGLNTHTQKHTHTLVWSSGFTCEQRSLCVWMYLFSSLFGEHYASAFTYTSNNCFTRYVLFWYNKQTAAVIEQSWDVFSICVLKWELWLHLWEEIFKRVTVAFGCESHLFILIKPGQQHVWKWLFRFGFSLNFPPSCQRIGIRMFCCSWT